MSDADLYELLQALGLVRIAEILKERLAFAQQNKWTIKRILKDLLTEERIYRQDRRLRGRIKRAHIPEQWTLETFPYDRQPGIDRQLINELAELDFVKTGTNLVFIALTGRGKSGLASSLLLKALLNGYTGMLQSTQEILDDLHRSIADRKTKYLLNKYSTMDVLVADEIGYLNLNDDQVNLFFKLMDNRYQRGKSTIITTNLGYDDWSPHFRNSPMVEPLKSRIKQRCVTITIDGPDLRSPAR